MNLKQPPHIADLVHSGVDCFGPFLQHDTNEAADWYSRFSLFGLIWKLDRVEIRRNGEGAGVPCLRYRIDV